MTKTDSLTWLLRRDPTYQATLEEVVARFDDLGSPHQALLSVLFASRKEDNWTGSEELMEKVARMAPNHWDVEVGKKTAHNLRLLGLLAFVQAELYEQYNEDHLT
jgi:hypothetical protein